jgi:hypothetical protein
MHKAAPVHRGPSGAVAWIWLAWGVSVSHLFGRDDNLIRVLAHGTLEGPAVESGGFWYDPSNHHLRAALGAYYCLG